MNEPNEPIRIGYFNPDGSPAMTHYEDMVDPDTEELTCGSTEPGDLTGAWVLVTCPDCQSHAKREWFVGDRFPWEPKA